MTPVSVDPLFAIVTYPSFKIFGFMLRFQRTLIWVVYVYKYICCETAKFHYVYLFSQRSVLFASDLTAFNPLYANGELVF